jgi:signal transduction histidine kinase
MTPPTSKLANKHYIRLLLHWRWLILAIAIPVSLLIEVLEGDTHDLHFLDEVIIDGMVLPITTWLVLTFAARKMTLQIAREEQLQQRQRFTQELAEHRDFAALTSWLVRFFGRELSVAAVSLALSESETDQLRPATQWHATADPVAPEASRAEPREYQFVILQNNAQIGLLAIRTHPGKTIARAQHELVTALLPEIARALTQAVADLQATQRVYREAQIRERRRIARELHDSLAQQVFYLHLNLDQMVEARTLADRPNEHTRIEALRDVAADVYDQIRHNLSILRAWEQVDLTEAISELARLTAYNADLEVEVTVHGQPEWLSPHTSERIYGVMREALHNVVKHAVARRIELVIDWSSEELHLTLTDDGVGFHPDAAPPDGHYGLSLMRETVDALQGVCTIDSAPGRGTRLQFSIPFQRAGVAALQSQFHAIDAVQVANVVQ